MSSTLKLRGLFILEKWNAMIEDPKLTLDILKYLARDDIGYPANVSVHVDLAREFPDEDMDRLEYHVACAFENDLLMGSYDRDVMMDGVIVNIGYIDGLSPRGGNYVRDAETKFWGKAWSKIEDVGVRVTTERLIEMVASLTSEALSRTH